MNLLPTCYVALALAILPALARESRTPAAPPVRIEVIQNLDFGDLLTEDFGGSLTLTERNDLHVLSGSIRPGLRARTQEARLLLVGPPRTPYALIVDPQQPLLDNGSGGSLRVVSFAGTPETFQGVFNDQGEAEVRFGARLDVPARALPGAYQSLNVLARLSVLGPNPTTHTERFAIRCTLRPLLHLRNLTPLDFGSIIPGDAPSTYRVHADGQTSNTGGARQYRGLPAPAEFIVTGSSGTEYSLQLPRQIYLQGPGREMVVHSFEANIPLPGRVPSGGFSFKVGASLTVPPDQRPGCYQGIFQVTIHYP